MQFAIPFNRGLKSLLALGLLVTLSGCATVHEMGIDRESTELKLEDKALLLMSLEVSNQYKKDYQPQIIVAHLEKPDAESKEDRHNFKTDLDGTVTSSNGTRYLLRMELDPGEYVVRGASCMYKSLFLIGSCLLPIHANIQVTGNSVTYLGRVTGTIRERVGTEFRAGPPIPLIDQAVTGFANGSFDVEISDEREADLKAYRELFPALSNTDIEIDILPPFDRARAQLWWETNGESDIPGGQQPASAKSASL